MKIKIKSVKKGVLNTQFGNGNTKDNSVSFPMKWQKVKGAKSYAIYVVDKESTNSLGTPFIHWIAANIKSNKVKWDFSFETFKNKNSNILQFANTLTKKAKHHIIENLYEEAIEGVFVGPFPPEADHNYEVHVYALNVENILDNTKFKKDDLLFLDDFENLIEGKIIDKGFTTFLYRSIYEIDADGKVKENGKTNLELNAPLKKDERNFFKNKSKIGDIKISSKAFLEKDNKIFLHHEHKLKTDADGNFYSSSIPLRWNEVSGAKSYLLTLISSREVKTFGVPLVLMNKFIKARNSQEILLELKYTKETSDEELRGLTTFGSYNLEKIISHLNLDPKTFLNVYNDMVILDFKELTNHDAFITLSIYATDIEFEELKEKVKNNGDFFSLTDSMKWVKSHVIGFGEMKLKLEK